jgi:hypothetical protein
MLAKNSILQALAGLVLSLSMTLRFFSEYGGQRPPLSASKSLAKVAPQEGPCLSKPSQGSS